MAAAINVGTSRRRVFIGRWANRPMLPAAAALGLALAVFEVCILVRWVSGPGFKAVATGPTDVPTWMKVAIVTAEVMFTGAGIVFFYWFLVRPWRRERKVSFDGLVCVAALLTSVYDASSCYLHNWFTYNAYFVNWGNPAASLPGWRAYAEPGETIAWPALFVPPVYVVLFVGLAIFGTHVMKTARNHWPHLPGIALVAICFVTLWVTDLFLEGQLFMRLGYYVETGTSFEFLDGTYNHNPIRNMLLFAVLFTGVSALRFFVNDRGQTLVERGAHRYPSGSAKVIAMRFFAVLAAVQVIIGVGYHLPMALTTLVKPDAKWHDVMVDNSYLNDHICGTGTPRRCPGH
jgi:hypothetical protein